MENSTIYEHHDGRLGVRARYLFDGRNAAPESLRLVGDRALRARIENETVVRLRPQSPGRAMLVEFSSLPPEWRRKIVDAFGAPPALRRATLFETLYEFDERALTFYVDYRYGDGICLGETRAREYAVNAGVLNAADKMRRKIVGERKLIRMPAAGTWECVADDVRHARETILHTLPDSSDRLLRTLNRYLREGYVSLIHKMTGVANRAKIKTREQEAVVDRFICFYNNFDNEKVAEKYNAACEVMGWEPVTGRTVENRRREILLAAVAGTRGKTTFMNEYAVQAKRRPPSAPMLFWTTDGWDVELFYRKTFTDKKTGKTVTTYHNRLTIVYVLDAYNKYPVGYAIGDTETIELIRAAMKDAIRNTKRLFGDYYKPYQIQGDRFGNGALKEFMEGLTKHYTPARAKNAKSKVIEPHNLYLNSTYCRELPNWSGYGVQSRKDSQPNVEVKNLIKKDFPDREGCVAQIRAMILAERAKTEARYVADFAGLTKDEHKLTMSAEHYLLEFGETTGFTNRIEASGLCPTILGAKRAYDCFDADFLAARHEDWTVRYDRDDLTFALAISKDGKRRFMLTEKYVQPMALADRTEGDAAKLREMFDFNASVADAITRKHAADAEILTDLCRRNPALESLTKMTITDSRGRHKELKYEERAKALAPATLAVEEEYEIMEENVRDSY